MCIYDVCMSMYMYCITGHPININISISRIFSLISFVKNILPCKIEKIYMLIAPGNYHSMKVTTH